MKILKLFLSPALDLFLVLGLFALIDRTTPSHNERFVIDTHHAFKNTWYQVANLTAKRLGFNASCYVCSWIPHHSKEVSIMTAVPISLNTTLCLFHQLTAKSNNYNCSLTHCCTPHFNRSWTKDWILFVFL